MSLVNTTGMSVFGGGRMYAVDEITRWVCCGGYLKFGQDLFRFDPGDLHGSIAGLAERE